MRGGVPFWAATDVRVILASSNDIQRMNVECFRDDAAQRKAPPPNTLYWLDPATLSSETSTPAHSMEQIGISGFPHVARSSTDAPV